MSFSGFLTPLGLASEKADTNLTTGSSPDNLARERTPQRWFSNRGPGEERVRAREYSSRGLFAADDPSLGGRTLVACNGQSGSNPMPRIRVFPLHRIR